jgi:putative phage-type endonuclease
MKQGTKEWHETRQRHIGASDAPVIMGVSPSRTLYQLYLEKIGKGEKVFETDAMRHGKAMEPKAREEFEALTGIVVFPTVVFHPKHKFMMASLDGMDLEKRFVLEAKCPMSEKSEDHICAMDGVVPEKYYPQLQHQLECVKSFGIDMIYYLSYTSNSSKLIEVEINQSYIDDMIVKHTEFWRRVQERDAPPMTEKDYIIREDEEWRTLEARWLFLKPYLEESEQLREKLINCANGQNVKGSNLTLSRFMRKGNVDYKSIPELKGINLEAYRKSPSECWKITEK